MPKLLSEDQVLGYERNGYVSPIDVLSAAEVKEFRQDLEGWEKQHGQAIDFPEKSKSYLLFNWADQLVHHPKILDAVEDVIGPDILVYHSTLFLKALLCFFISSPLNIHTHTRVRASPSSSHSPFRAALGPL
jgi:hypothetical protein